MREIANSFICEKFRSVSSSELSPNRISLIEIDQRYFYVLSLDSIISQNLIPIEIMLLSTADIFQLTDISNDDEEKGRREWDLESVEGNKRSSLFRALDIFLYKRSCVLCEKTLAQFLDTALFGKKRRESYGRNRTIRWWSDVDVYVCKNECEWAVIVRMRGKRNAII